MDKDVFFRSNRMSITLEQCIPNCESFEDFEKQFSDELLNDDCRQCDIMEVYSCHGNIISFLDYKDDIPMFVRKEEK